MYQQTEALVLKTVDFSETSLVLTMFSRNFGKIRALAKGGRRIKGPFESALDLMSHVLVTYIPKRGDALDLLTESKLIRRFRPTKTNYGGMFAGYYLIELINEMTIEREPMPELFDAAVECMTQLIAGKPVMPNLMHFEWRLLELTGHFPSLVFCVQCDDEIDLAQRRIAFGHIDGGVVCDRCRAGTQQVSLITPELIRAIRQWNAVERGDAEFEPSQQGPMRALLNQYLSHLIGKRPIMFDHLGKMQNTGQ